MLQFEWTNTSFNILNNYKTIASQIWYLTSRVHSWIKQEWCTYLQPSVIIKFNKEQDTFAPIFWFFRLSMTSFYFFQCLFKHLLKHGCGSFIQR